MKKSFLFLLFAVLLSLTGLEAQMFSPAIYSNLVIAILPTKPKPSIRPLSLEQPNIEAYYNGVGLTLVFNRDLGDADIVVTNLTTGEMWSDSISGICSTTILLSGDEGYYHIAIYTDSGDYIGEFNL